MEVRRSVLFKKWFLASTWKHKSPSLLVVFCVAAKITLNQPLIYEFLLAKVPLVFCYPLCVCLSKQITLFYSHTKLVELLYSKCFISFCLCTSYFLI
jgi:hypothetical protein